MVANKQGPYTSRAPLLCCGARRLFSIVAFAVSLTVQANAGPNDDILAAATAGDRAGAEAAFAAGASVNAVDPLGMPGETTPLSITAAKGHRNVAEFLLDHGANVNGGDGLEQTPLHTAADRGNDDVAKLLIDRGANIDARDFLGATPLQYAAMRGHETIVVLLLARGAIMNAQSKFGKTALHLAAAAGHKEVVGVLLAHGADSKIKNSDGRTALQEMRASALDPATKAKMAVMLGAKPTPAQVQNPVPAAVPAPPASSQTPVPVGPPACTDVAGIARGVMQANPGISPRVLAGAVDQVQIAMGCRPPAVKTECSWVGDTWTCTTK